jgi:hypothetical protein
MVYIEVYFDSNRMHPVHVQVYVSGHALDLCNRIQHVHFVHTIQYMHAT